MYVFGFSHLTYIGVFYIFFEGTNWNTLTGTGHIFGNMKVVILNFLFLNFLLNSS